MTATQIPRPTAGPAMTPHTVRCDRETWEEAAEVAAAEGLDISKVVRHYLRHYVDTAPGRK